MPPILSILETNQIDFKSLALHPLASFLSRLHTGDLVLFVPEVGKSQISLLPEADGIEPARGNASHESAWGKRSAIECRPNPKFREARFWITCREVGRVASAPRCDRSCVVHTLAVCLPCVKDSIHNGLPADEVADDDFPAMAIRHGRSTDMSLRMIEVLKECHNGRVATWA